MMKGDKARDQMVEERKRRVDRRSSHSQAKVVEVSNARCRG